MNRNVADQQERVAARHAGRLGGERCQEYRARRFMAASVAVFLCCRRLDAPVAGGLVLLALLGEGLLWSFGQTRGNCCHMARGVDADRAEAVLLGAPWSPACSSAGWPAPRTELALPCSRRRWSRGKCDRRRRLPASNGTDPRNVHFGLGWAGTPVGGNSRSSRCVGDRRWAAWWTAVPNQAGNLIHPNPDIATAPARCGRGVTQSPCNPTRQRGLNRIPR